MCLLIHKCIEYIFFFFRWLFWIICIGIILTQLWYGSFNYYYFVSDSHSKLNDHNAEL